MSDLSKLSQHDVLVLMHQTAPWKIKRSCEKTTEGELDTLQVENAKILQAG